jgi:hypothetical protein
MIFRQSPFKGENEDEIYDSILAGNIAFTGSEPTHISSFISRLLTREPEKEWGRVCMVLKM